MEQETKEMENAIVATNSNSLGASYSEIKRLHEQGNESYKKKDFECALKLYKQALESIYSLTNLDEQLKELRTTLHLNLCGVYLKQKKWEDTIEQAIYVLNFQPQNVKALWRRGNAYLQMGNFEQARIDFENGLSIDANNKELKASLDELKNKSQNPVFVQPESVVLEGFDERGVIPRLDYRDPSIYKYILNDLPVILTGCPLVKSALGKWDLDYLCENIIENDNSVFVSTGNQFMYYDEQRNGGKYPFQPKTFQLRMSCKQFVQQLQANINNGPLKLYMQQSLTKECSGPKIVQDFQAFDWNWLLLQQAKLGMGNIKNNTLWVGMPGVVTPSHFDEAHNFFTQVQGRKLFRLHSPKYYGCMYPFPLHHPHDRQCQVNIEDPDLERFPKYKNAREVKGIVYPGDVLYLPPYWFHYVRSLDVTVSVNFWYVMKNDRPEDITFPLKKQSQVMAFRRNIEKYIADTMGPNNVATFLDDLYIGRFNSSLYNIQLNGLLPAPQSQQQKQLQNQPTNK